MSTAVETNPLSSGGVRMKQAGKVRTYPELSEREEDLDEVDPEAWIISAPLEDSLSNETRKDIAKIFLNIERILMEAIENRLRWAGLPEAIAPASTLILMPKIRKFVSEHEQIRLGLRGVHKTYLANRDMLKIWREAELFVMKVLHDSGDAKTAVNELKEMMEHIENISVDLPNLISATLMAGPLDTQILKVIKDKISELDMITRKCVRSSSFQSKRLTWPHIVGSISLNNLRASLGTKAKPMNSDAVLHDDRRRLVLGWKVSTIMWLNFTSTTVCTLPAVAVGWQHSEHLAGTVKDADFWFLLQSCIMQVSNTLTVAVLLQNDHNLLGVQRWYTAGAMSGVVICSPASLIAYCFLTTEWSALLNVLAGSIQAFVTLQLALMIDKRSVEKTEHKQGKKE
ncbi:hypothetical protein FH972_024570 [Carpinus fangiana]|uniref:Uncharacterized protein n=1 Tax=Carpinus fangiana TaxID=176857 RepID=A0A5N6KYU9_9ROSI|nr:hypothetical protein FH972_024570 [Carpinus fangiana]